MNQATPGERLRYAFDNFLSRGTAALVAALFTITACLILSTAGVLVAAGLKPGDHPGPLGFAEATWLAATRVLDPGTVADDSGRWYRLVGVLVTLGGIFLTSALIGILVNGLDQHLGKMRRGRTPVVESGHLLILGWSPHIYTILHELACADRIRRLTCQNGRVGAQIHRRACVVILADQDRLEMEEEIRLRVPDRQGMRIVCRSGDPLDLDVLKIVSPQSARAVIILSPGGDYPDLPVGRALLALARAGEQHRLRSHIVATVQRAENLQLMRMIGGERAQLFLVEKLLGYLLAQACLQPGLGLVYAELLRFGGANIRFVDPPALTAETYGKVLGRLSNATLVGLQSAGGAVRLSPPLDTSLQPGDRLVVIHTPGTPIQIFAQALGEPSRPVFHPIPTAPDAPQRLLILGWNQRAPFILEYLRLAASPGFQVKVFTDVPAGTLQAGCSGTGWGSLRVTFEEGNPLDRPSMERLISDDYPYILILSPNSQLGDVFSAASYLHLRDIANKTGRSYSILVEMISGRKGDLALVNCPDDATINNSLMALILAQIAENVELGPILIELLGPGGAQIVLRPAGDYVSPGEKVTFQTVVTAAGCREETALGYRLFSEASQAGGASGVHLNPEKSISIIFTEQDEVILLATEGQHSR
ncbi:hypothetical protein ADN00_00670 [Ornatilinea apprima]|uniref:RCK C-terminal domain-containing protein n=1 Tax=Ornatilinea apprima TaxID=1134406 RepID=A0A0P6XX16_9CHLR|nr:hypothetical protein [Ornatilinea apprima]KPL81076.1 hypothetical protein ADN00_00670 [Ornatilinea apprima]